MLVFNRPLFFYKIAGEIFIAHLELNASAVARRLGIAQSLLAQYISGFRKPSEKTARKIEEKIKEFAKEIESVRFV